MTIATKKASQNYRDILLVSRLLVYVTLSIGILSSCVNIARYPAGWEKLATSIPNIEQDIAGEYYCRGASLRPSTHEVMEGSSNMLRHLHLFKPEDLLMQTGRCDTVRFRQIKEGELEVTIIGGGIAPKSVTLKDGKDYSTENGWLVFNWHEGGVERESWVLGGGFGAGSDSFTLTKSGDLVVRASGSVAAFLVVVPFLGYASDWYLYKRKPN